MNREIKFRGRSEYGAFVYGDLIQYENGDAAIFEKKLTKYGCEATEICKRTKVNPKIVSQFTGLYDKNGTEIYEGDILRVYDGEKYFNIVVKWSEEAMAFMACYPDGNQSPLSWFSNLLSRTYEIEVIGNIYDNKELLEETE